MPSATEGAPSGGLPTSVESIEEVQLDEAEAIADETPPATAESGGHESAHESLHDSPHRKG